MSNHENHENNQNSGILIEESVEKPHAVYRSQKANPSYMITIPKKFAKAMRIDKPNSFVITRLVNEEEILKERYGDIKKKKRVYCIIEKFER